MSVWRNRHLLSVSVGHMTIDSFNSMGPVLLAALSVPMALSNAQVGFALTLYIFTSSLLQPLFGWLGDRLNVRLLIAGSVVWTCVFLVLASQAPSYSILLVPFLIAALGSAAFHPAGTMQATLAGRGAQAATATSIFFLFGQIGLAAGPIVGGAVLEFMGTSGLPLLLVFILPVAVALYRRPALKPTAAGTKTTRPVQQPDQTRQVQTNSWKGFAYVVGAAFVIMVFLRSVGQHGIMSFLPMFYSQQGLTSSQYGLMAGAFIFASAWGGVAGGWISDRWSHKGVLIGSMVLGFIPGVIFPVVSPMQAVPLLVAAGFLMGAGHSVLIVMAQRMLPGRMALASGLMLGFMFAAGGVGTFLAGYFGDIVGLATTMQGLASLMIVAALFALVLPRRSQQTAPTPAHTQTA